MVFPGHTFTRRMYSKYATVVNYSGVPQNANEFKLKQHHHVRLDVKFKFDCKIWLEFLSGKLSQVVNRPMVDILGTVNTSVAIEFYLDTSAADTLGFGAILNSKWIRGDWGVEFMKEFKPSIDYLELFTLCAGIFTWQDQPQLGNCQISVYCDNMGVVHMINSTVSKCPECMHLLWLLTLNNLKFNRRVTALYVTSKNNFLSDALSRNQMARFWKLGPHMNPHPDVISQEIWPVCKLWENSDRI